MDFFGGYKSPFGYENGDNGVDSYGVDHSGFSTQDELQYQTARTNREQQLADDLQQQGVAEENYPQYGLSFWGNSANNYGFGVRNIAQNAQNHPTMNMTPMQNLEPQEKNEYNSQVSSSTNVWSQQKNRNMENNLLMSGMDTLYGMNRAINGMTFGGLDYLGNKLGFDSQMNDYLNLKDEQSRNLAQTVGKMVEFGGGLLSGGAIGAATYEPANMMYQGYKIGKAYDRLSQNPFAGNGADVIARMKNHSGEPVLLQRGEVIRGKNGNVIVHGKALGRETGTFQNYGLNKGIYRHGVNRYDAQRIPRIIKNNPVETNDFGQNVYMSHGKNSDIKIVTSPTNNGVTVSSMYYPRK